MKKFFYIIVAFFTFAVSLPTFAALSEAELKNALVPASGRNTISAVDEGTGLLDYLLGFLRDSIFALMAVIAVGMFLFIGGRLVVARGNPEEFKKALQSFIYAAVGIFLVAFAWAIVKIIAGIDI